MLAFAVPIVPGKEDDFQAFVGSLTGDEADRFSAFNERKGLTTHRAWLQQNPDGSQLAVVVLDGEGAEGFLASVAMGDHEDDEWFRENIANIHGMDFSAPPPPAPQPMI